MQHHGLCIAGVGLLTTSGVDPNVGDALCIGSAALFGVHKWRSETATAQHSAATNELIAVQLLVLASAAALVSLPQFAGIAAQGPGKHHVEQVTNCMSNKLDAGRTHTLALLFPRALISIRFFLD